MAGNPPSAKRMKTMAVRSGEKLEGWFVESSVIKSFEESKS